MLIKKLSQIGDCKAIVIDESILQAAGLDENSLFSITLHPNGGLTILSVELSHEEIKESAFHTFVEENHDLLKRLRDR